MKKPFKRIAVRAAIVLGDMLIVLVLLEVLVRLFMPLESVNDDLSRSPTGVWGSGVQLE